MSNFNQRWRKPRDLPFQQPESLLVLQSVEDQLERKRVGRRREVPDPLWCPCRSGRRGRTQWSPWSKTNAYKWLPSVWLKQDAAWYKAFSWCAFCIWKHFGNFADAFKGGSSGLVVMWGNSRSEGRGFESKCRILEGHLFTLIFCKIVLMYVWKKTKNKNEKGRR